MSTKTPTTRGPKAETARSPKAEKDQEESLRPSKDYIDATKIAPVKAVLMKYHAKKWDTLDVSDKKAVNDIIAKKGDKLHFTQICLDDTEAKHHGESKNMFIQNAMSNNALPVLAIVRKIGVRTAEGGKMTTYKITYRDVNTNARILI